MKNLILVLILSFGFIACTGSTSSSDGSVPQQGQKSPQPNPTPSDVNLAPKLAKNLLSQYESWKTNCASLIKPHASPEQISQGREYLLGAALRNVYEINSQENLFLVRADFKKRQGPQSENDFLPLAKQILETN